MKKSIFSTLFFAGFIVLATAQGSKHTTQQKKVPNAKSSDKGNFCALAKTLLDNCPTDFKNIAGEQIDSMLVDSQISVVQYKTTLEIPGAIYSKIYKNSMEGYNYEALLLETTDVKQFRDMYNKYAAEMKACKNIELVYTDSTSADIPKKYPLIVFLKKGAINKNNEAMPHSIRLRSLCQQGIYYSLYIEVYPKRK